MGKYDDKTVDLIMDMYLKEQKSGQRIAAELGIPRSTVYYYIQKNTEYDELAFTKRNFRYLINRSKHLESVVSVLQESNCSANDPLFVFFSVIIIPPFLFQLKMAQSSDRAVHVWVRIVYLLQFSNSDSR